MSQLGLMLIVVLVLAGVAATPSHGASGSELDVVKSGIAYWTNETSSSWHDACGYGDDAYFLSSGARFGSDGDYCGVCFRVTCTTHPACSTTGVRLTVTDQHLAACEPGAANTMMELSNNVFGSLAESPQRADELRAAIAVGVTYKREDCYYEPLPIKLHVDPSSTNQSFAVTVSYLEGTAGGKAVTVFFKNAEQVGSTWQLMSRIKGATWKATQLVSPPLSMMVVMPWLSGRIPNPQVEEGTKVIPADWKPGQTYVIPKKNL